MEEMFYEKMRDKKRYDVNVKATYIIRELGKQQQDCRIVNLSSSGAKVHFPHTASFKNGAFIAVDISMPNTIMRITTEAEIMWTKHHFNELMGGIRFTGALSDNMLQQVVNNIPQLSDYTELIW